MVVPNYNRASLLPETLDNLLNQTLPPYEIIVVDDSSTDNYQQVVEQYKDRVIFIKNRGKGPGSGRNSGFEIATGKYLKYSDSDDVMTRNSLQVQAEVLHSTGQAMVYGPYVHVRKSEAGSWEQADAVIQYKPIPANQSLRQCMARGFFTVIPGMLFETDFLKEMGPWRTDITAYEDWDLLWRIGGKVNNPAHSNECAYFYRLHGAQTTGGHFNNEARDKEKLICYTDAYKSIGKTDSHFSGFDKKVMETQVWNTLSYLKHLPEYAEQYRLATNSGVKLIAKYLRVLSKINRMQTKSEWQVMHGVNSDREIFAHYLSLIS